MSQRRRRVSDLIKSTVSISPASCLSNSNHVESNLVLIRSDDPTFEHNRLSYICLEFGFFCCIFFDIFSLFFAPPCLTYPIEFQLLRSVLRLNPVSLLAPPPPRPTPHNFFHFVCNQ